MRHSHIIFLIAFAVAAMALAPSAFAATTDELQTRIDQREADIKALEKEIAGYQIELNALGNRRLSLSETLKSLDLTLKKLQADISLTEDKIDAKNLEIQRLSREITGKNTSIEDNRRIAAESFRRMNEQGDRSVAKYLLGGETISDIWNSIARLAIMEVDLEDRINLLSAAKNSLESNKRSTERAKADLVKLQEELADQRKIALTTKAEQTRILNATKSSESNFQKLLEDKQALRKAFEDEIAQYESELKLSVDISKLPKSGSQVLSWPMDNVFITQYFGNTPFATANAQLYRGYGHNGVDFRASIGTPVKAALSGTVVALGDTDLIPGCYSLGKWILLKHGNGLTTLYAHLSLHSTSFGSQVHTGETIGYSGNTGYTTGPHLHFGVYASSGIEIKQFTTSKNCQGAIIPIAVLQAYLNPLSYLPTLAN